MEYVVYVLRSQQTDRYYIGSTRDLDERLANHNRGSTRSTKPYRPWQVVYTETYNTRIEAEKRERQLKSYKGGEAFKELFSDDGGVA